MRTPPLFQREYRDGRKGGSWHTRLGKDHGVSRPLVINLKTKNLKRAEERRREAMAGKRQFEYDDTWTYRAPAEVAPPVETPTAPPAAPQPSTVEFVEAERIERDVPDDTSWASDLGAAAGAGAPPPPSGESGPEKPVDSPKQPDGAGVPVDPEMLVGLCSILVDAQLTLQAWAIGKASKGKKIAGEIPGDSPVREKAARLWAAQLPIWFPDMGAIPPWVQAVAMVGACTIAQAANATDAPPKEPERRDGLPRVEVVR